MKKYILYLFAASLTLGFQSCKKDFLDSEPSQRLSPEQLSEAGAKDPSLLNGYIAGIYATMYKTQSGGTTNHDDFGQKGYDIYFDLLSSDMVLAGNNYGWYTSVARFQASANYTLDPAKQAWTYFYKQILSANSVIDALGGNDVVPADAQSKAILGQAKAMRAHSYFYLAQLYSKQGYGTGNDKILPLYTSAKQEAQPLSTTKEVYDVIIKDLNDAIVLLDKFNRNSKDQINKYVAKGILAYAYAARGTQADLREVVALTADVMTNGGFPLTSKSQVVAQLDANGRLTNPDAGFNNINTPSWMWGVDLTAASNLDLVSWWGQVDYFTYSYAAAGDPKKIDKGLYDAIPSTDIRKKQYSSSLLPYNKFFDPKRVAMGQRIVTTDYIYMRIDEMYLLNAEAHAKLAEDGQAKTSLKQLLALRVDNPAYVDALSGKALQDEIYLQTRIELWGEGKVYLALKRNQATVVRGSNHLYEAGKSFAYNSDQLSFPIPQTEILNNPSLN